MITDIGLNRMGTSSDWLTYCQVGTGSTSPSESQTALTARIAGTSTRVAGVTGVSGSSPWYGYRQNTYEFAAGVATGTLAEFGIGWATSGSIFSRALILDEMESPTTLTVLADEILQIDYEVRYYSPTVDVTGTINLASVDYDYTSRASNASSASYWGISAIGVSMEGGSAGQHKAYSGTIGAVTSSPSGTSSASDSRTNLAYGTDDFYLEMSVTWGLTKANFGGGIQSIEVRFGIGSYQTEFDPPIPKTETDVLSLTFKHSWDRAA
jgi:hypothetical protein